MSIRIKSMGRSNLSHGSPQHVVWLAIVAKEITIINYFSIKIKSISFQAYQELFQLSGL